MQQRKCDEATGRPCDFAPHRIVAQSVNTMSQCHKPDTMIPLLQKLLFALPPEVAHELVKTVSHLVPADTLKKFTQIKSKSLRTGLGKVKLANPIGLAAGFDKNGDMVAFLASLGFGFLELGSVTALPCNGNPKPRLFRLTKDRSLINRMGLPNIGANAFVQKMTREKTVIPYGVNIAKTPDSAQKGEPTNGIEDFLTTLRRVYFLGNYLVFNLSCPNTNEGRTFEDPDLFNEFARAVAAEKKHLALEKPVLVKFSPDLKTAQLTALVETSVKHGFDGFVLTNTTTNRHHLKTSREKLKAIGPGGLSGAALKELSNQQIRKVFDIVKKDKIIMGAGGIMGFGDLLEKMSCGASLFQVYTGFVYGGPFFVKKLVMQLDAFCRERGVKNYRELVGEKGLSDEL